MNATDFTQLFIAHRNRIDQLCFGITRDRADSRHIAVWTVFAANRNGSPGSIASRSAQRCAFAISVAVRSLRLARPLGRPGHRQLAQSRPSASRRTVFSFVSAQVDPRALSSTTPGPPPRQPLRYVDVVPQTTSATKRTLSWSARLRDRRSAHRADDADVTRR